jgi:SAM-dependent methyltransferase/uncharacterized protein YbaR (Trm112 family)
MLLGDVVDLACTACAGGLRVRDTRRSENGYLIEGTLGCEACELEAPVRAGIPRFLHGVTGYNESWNYKWATIDRRRALNHAILDRNDPAYALHDLYDRNSDGGRAFAYMRGRRAIEIGCGVGQYVVKSLIEHAPEKIVALDLTEGVDTLRAIVAAKYPHLLEKILFVQASVFAMPFRPASFDYVYSLGVLHHTGRTEHAVRAAAALLKAGGHLNLWIYAAALYHMDTREAGREALSRWAPLLRIGYTRLQARAWYALFSRMTPAQADRALRPFSSDAWYRLARTPVLKVLTRLVMSPPPHPDRDYRHLNLFDGYVNAWAENWSEPELFAILRDCGIAVKGISPWRLGMWGVKQPEFYDAV